MRRTVAELCKEINGKQVVWVRGDGHTFGVNAIIYAPPKGSSIVVKPYGYEPEDLLEIFNSNGWDTTLSQISRPTFCLSRYGVGDKDIAEILRKLVEIPDGGECNCDNVLKVSTSPGGGPICPYA